MADDIDTTDIRQQHILDTTIKNISAAAAKIDIVGTGDCVVCGNEVESVVCNGKQVIGRWHSSECRDRNDL